MISLGVFDANVGSDKLAAYQQHVKELTQTTALPEWKDQLREEGKWVKYQPLTPAADQMKVTELQQFLRDAGFLPFAQIDGICGYRTTAGIFLFQEYVRTIEGKSEIGFPDGKFGNNTLQHARRWQANQQKADWTEFSNDNSSPEYTQWSNLLKAAKVHYQATPSSTMQKVQAASGCNTLKVADWDFDPNKIHLLGLRHRKENLADKKQSLDDAFVLLIHGSVFKFFGSTEPGTKEGSKYPFLVPGQHRYRFGWHHQAEGKKLFQALRPLDKGVWVQRSVNLIPTDADLAGPLDGPNTTINIHWGGGGLTDSAGWSAGCQVIAGKSYSNHHGQVVDCSKFAANGYEGLGTNASGVYQSKGAYSMLEHLVAAFSGKNPNDNVVHYTLLNEADLALNPAIGVNQNQEIVKALKA